MRAIWSRTSRSMLPGRRASSARDSRMSVSAARSVRGEGKTVRHAEARAARRVEEREEVLGGHQDQGDRAELDLAGAREEVDELRLLPDEARGLVEEDEEVGGVLSDPLLEDIEHLREGVAPVGERNLYHAQ